MFDRIVRNVSEFTALQSEIGATTPRVSLWLTGLKETVDQLPDFVRLAARIGVREVHLQRLVFDDLGRGLARADSSLFERTQKEEEEVDRRRPGARHHPRRHHGRLRRHRAGPQPQAWAAGRTLVRPAAARGR